MSYMAQRVAGFGTTIFTEMTALANEHQAINLGQGFPDFAAPAFMKEAAVAAIEADVNQYAPANGRPRLRQAIAQKVHDFYGLEANPDTEITVLHGATEAIFATILGLVNPGDEVIVFEPFYDSYVPAIQMAGGVKTVFFGGEGLFLTTLTGPGKVVLQSMDIAKLASSLIPFLPQNSSGK